MDIFDQKKVLESMVIYIDSREQPTKRAFKRYETFGCPYKNKIPMWFGDYTYNATLPDGSEIIPDHSEKVVGKCVIERKMDLDELAMCFGRGRDRFQREFQKSIDHHARFILLVENATWEKLILGKYKSKMHPKAFFSSLTSWMIRYNTSVIFCKEETSGKIIRELLYRDLKERLERGEFDG